MIQGNIHNPKKSGKLKKGEAKRTGNKNVQFELLNLRKGGVITIITKEPADYNRKVNTPGILTIHHPGYHQARTFYAPDYAADGVDKDKPDYRTTLYWDSTAKVETKKATPFSFYTGDKLSEFLIFVEGITSDGQPIVGQKTITVTGNTN